jgi:hypothetical protein
LEHDEQLAWEARAGKPAAAAALASAVLGFGGWGLYQSVIAGREDGSDGFLQAVDEHASDFVTSGALQAASLLLLAPVLLYLFRAIRHRRPELSQMAAVLGVLGAIGFAVSTVIQQTTLVDVARDFFPFEVPDGFEDLTGDAYAEAVDPDKAAEERVRDELSPALQGLGLGATFALAFSVVMIAVNAMRVGLLSRFMGVLGIGMGVMFVIPFGVQPVLQLFWLGALAVMFLGRWPGGRGPAWETGEPIPWPSGAPRRGEPEPEPEPEPKPEPQIPRPASRKRKRKRR